MWISSLLGEFECVMWSIICSACAESQHSGCDISGWTENKNVLVADFSVVQSKIILKQLFTSGSVNIGEYLLRLWRIIVNYDFNLCIVEFAMVSTIQCGLISSWDDGFGAVKEANTGMFNFYWRHTYIWCVWYYKNTRVYLKLNTMSWCWPKLGWDPGLHRCLRHKLDLHYFMGGNISSTWLI